ncbi:neither inactivation nor afterpotential protein C isoform X2 [Ischnura elegans]|uniref:neither inactivation nor afterpotential protein C isoform X2 n=1 Tax=Ischnura elegans TaxID=197161 RepID=UPI001ED874F8|nr:neither inactivation nor afterpotential protein C isoform X2 [Ischnura elegans]
MGDRGGVNLDSLPEPGNRYTLGDRLGSGVSGDVFEASDSQSGGMKVAIKIQRVSPSAAREDAIQEVQILQELSSHPNFPDFHGVYMKRGARSEEDRLWIVMEYCEGGPATDLVAGLHSQNKKMSEVHIAYILRETVKALVHLHESNIIHRDIRGSNILLTKGGEVKLCDFGLSRRVKGEMGKRQTVLGSPCWIAPEVVTSDRAESDGYDIRSDIWSVGITAIELGDGSPPFINIHPTRALFQIVRNPPPTLYRPANWTQNYNDFISECLVKNPEHRPFSVEVMEHPFLTSLPENEFLLQQDLKTLVADMRGVGKPFRKSEVAVRKGCLQSEQGTSPEPMFTEDLAALDVISEDLVLDQLHQRLRRGLCHTFIGDVLLFLNPNEQQNIYTKQHHTKYSFKALSDNAPHVFSMADRAYQDMLHHDEPQHILLAGESLSGKTTNFGHLVKHLIHLGECASNAGNRIQKSLEIIHAMGNAATPINRNSTRHVLHLEVTFSSTGKCSGAIFWVFQLERWRVTSNDRDQANFHWFYYFFAGMEETGKIYKYGLEPGGGGISRYRYLRTIPKSTNAGSLVGEFDLGTSNEGVGSSVEVNAQRWKRIASILKDDLEFDESEMQTLFNVTAAIILMGEIRFREVMSDEEGEKPHAEIENPDTAVKVANLLGVDEKKLSWALVNYCFIEGGAAQRRRHSKSEAEEARDALARATYARLFDWVVNTINHRLSLTRAVFGDKHCVTVLDLFGFECYQRNSLEQLFVNALNEQLQYHYNQRVFVWEMQECEEEDLKTPSLAYYDNKPALDALMGKPEGALHCIDEATRTGQGNDFILAALRNAASKGPHVRVATGAGSEFSVAHYTGKVSYEITDMAEKNRDFVPPETIDTMRQSTDAFIKSMFTNQLSRTGNLTVAGGKEEAEKKKEETTGAKKKGRKWGAALMAENTKTRTYNTEIRGQYSQTRKMRTAAAIYRATCLELLRGFSSSPSQSLPTTNGETIAPMSSGGSTLFIRCIRPSLSDAPRSFQTDVVRQQMRALAILDTARARQQGYSHRISFHEFLRRYKFLAFDFDENVEMNMDNCRLLMVRLKMEGFAIGKSKVFLKYYNEEYLSRLYEIQVKKIVKVQSMMRAFLAKRNVKVKKQASTQEDPEAEFRGDQCRKKYKVSGSAARDMDEVTVNFIREFCHRWKAKSIFQVLLHYRAARRQDLVYYSQQVHLYNQSTISRLQQCRYEVPLSNVDSSRTRPDCLPKPSVNKLPFRIIDVPHFWDTSALCDPARAGSMVDDQFDWDAPLRRRDRAGRRRNTRDQEVQTGAHGDADSRRVSIGHTQAPFCRYPNSGAPIGYAPSAHGHRGPTRNIGGRPTAPDNPAPPPPVNRNRFEPSSSTSADIGVTMSVSERRSLFSNDSRSNSYTPSPGIREQQRKFNGGASSSSSDSNGDPITSPRPSIEDDHGTKMKNNDTTKDTDNNFSSEADEDNNSLAKRIDALFGDVEGIAEAKPKKVYNDRPVNPVYEMEMKASRGDPTQDGAPFNFQGMLRKTNYSRASLKRGRQTDDFGQSSASFGGVSSYGSRGGDNRSFNHTPDSSRNMNGPSFNSYTPSRPRRNSDKWKEQEDNKVHQLAPGIVLEGEEEEL